MTDICICGGGSLGHVCAGVLASNPHVRLRIHSRQPERWKSEVRVTDPKGHTYVGKITCITNSYAKAIEGCNIVLLCLPGFAIAETLADIRPYLAEGCAVGAIVGCTGFFFHAHQLLSPTTPLFTFRRVPFIARVETYGSRAQLLGYKAEVDIAVEHITDAEAFRATIENLFVTPTRLLNNFYEASLSNSNPILHTGRLYTLWKDWNGEATPSCGRFYKEWTDEASACIISMDEEFSKLLDCLPVDKKLMPSLLEYYECTDAASLTRKISSIPAFIPICSPMKQTPEGWIPDFESRYFTEDFPCGLLLIKKLAKAHGVSTPVIDRVLEWGLKNIERTSVSTTDKC